MECAPGAIGDVAQVAEQRAFLAFFDLGVGLFATANAIEKILDVNLFALRPCATVNLVAFGIKNPVAAALIGERTVVAVKGDECQLLLSAGMATAVVPHRSLFTKVKYGRAGVGRFLIVIEMISATVEGEAGWIIDTETPAGDVQGVNAIVGEFAAAPVPAPMPVVRKEVIQVGPLRGTLVSSYSGV